MKDNIRLRFTNGRRGTAAFLAHAAPERNSRSFVGNRRGTAIILARQRPEWPFLSQRPMPAVL